MLDVAPVRHLMLTDAARLFNNGTPVSRSALAVAAALSAPGAVAPPGCQSRVLAAPLYEDHWRRTTNPANEREQFIRDSLASTKFTVGPLVDAVVFQTGDVKYATFYLFVPRMVLESHLRATPPTSLTPVPAFCSARSRRPARHLSLPTSLSRKRMQRLTDTIDAAAKALQLPPPNLGINLNNEPRIQ
jgi:hypothetical protein